MAKKKRNKPKRSVTRRRGNNRTRRPPIFEVIKLETVCRENKVPPDKVDGFFDRVYGLIKENAPKAAIAALIRCILEELKRYLSERIEDN